MASHTDPFSIRLPRTLYDRVFSVIAATEGEVTRTEIIHRALEFYIAILTVSPSILPVYDITKDKSVTQAQQPVTHGKDGKGGE